MQNAWDITLSEKQPLSSGSCLPCLRKVHRECLSWAKKAKGNQRHWNCECQGEVKRGCHLWATKRCICFYFCNIFSNHQIILKHLKMIISIIATIPSALYFHNFVAVPAFSFLLSLWVYALKKFLFFCYMLFKRRADVNSNISQEADFGTVHMYV